MLLLLLLLQLLLLVVLLLHSRNNQLRVRHDLGKRARDPRMPGRSIIITIIISITRLMMIAGAMGNKLPTGAIFSAFRLATLMRQ